jgi:hypothetical protein
MIAPTGSVHGFSEGICWGGGKNAWPLYERHACGLERVCCNRGATPGTVSRTTGPSAGLFEQGTLLCTVRPRCVGGSRAGTTGHCDSNHVFEYSDCCTVLWHHALCAVVGAPQRIAWYASQLGTFSAYWLAQCFFLFARTLELASTRPQLRCRVFLQFDSPDLPMQSGATVRIPLLSACLVVFCICQSLCMQKHPVTYSSQGGCTVLGWSWQFWRCRYSIHCLIRIANIHSSNPLACNL